MIPNVIPPDGKDSYELEYDYDPSGGDPSSTAPVQLAACLRAGQVPEAYRHAIESADIVEKANCVRRPEHAAPDIGRGIDRDGAFEIWLKTPFYQPGR